MATRPNAETLTQNTTKYKNSAKSTDDKRNSFQGTQKSDARGLDMFLPWSVTHEVTEVGYLEVLVENELKLFLCVATSV